MASTYELVEAARKLTGQAMDGFDVEADGTSPGEAAWDEAVKAFALESGDKFAALRAVMTRAEVEADAYKSEAMRLQAACARASKVAERVAGLAEALLREHVELTGVAKVPTQDGGWVALRSRTSQAVEIVDDAALTPAWVRMTVEPDKAAIRRELLAGREVAGAVLVEKTTETVTWSK